MQAKYKQPQMMKPGNQSKEAARLFTDLTSAEALENTVSLVEP